MVNLGWINLAQKRGFCCGAPAREFAYSGNAELHARLFQRTTPTAHGRFSVFCYGWHSRAATPYIGAMD
jgi:hypothetical protein